MNEKIKGTNAERLISLLLKLQFKKIQLILRSDLDIDIELYKNDVKLLIEVKSCSHYIKGNRKGRFVLRYNDFDCNYFCFMIPEIKYIKFVDKKDVESFLYKNKKITIWSNGLKKLETNSLIFKTIKNCKLSQKEVKFDLKGVKINDIYK